MNKRPIILDTDPGIDDAVAIAIALFSEELDVRLITTVAGNVGLDAVTDNALRLLAYFEKEVPVARGAGRPLLRPFEDASNVHGKTGLEGFVFDRMNGQLLLKEHAVNAMYRVLRECEEPVTLVGIGPLTNFALLFSMYPDCGQYIREIVLMGGAVGRGNKGVLSEFNIATDPEAARIVFSTGLPIVMAPMDLGPQTVILPEDSKRLEHLNRTGEMLYALFTKHRSKGMKTGLKMYDSCAIAYLLKPDLFVTRDVAVEIELAGTYTAGATLVDLMGYLHREPNVKVCLEVERSAFNQWFFDSLQKCI